MLQVVQALQSKHVMMPFASFDILEVKTSLHARQITILQAEDFSSWLKKVAAALS